MGSRTIIKQDTEVVDVTSDRIFIAKASIIQKRVIVKKEPGISRKQNKNKNNNEPALTSWMFDINFMYDDDLMKLAKELGIKIKSDEVDKFLCGSSWQR